MKTKLHRWVMTKIEDSKWTPWWLHGLLHQTICLFTGHTPERDQCGKPEHDFCLWCMKSLPNSWKKP